MDWNEFLNSNPQIREKWKIISKKIPEIQIPVVIEGNEGKLEMSWSNDRYRLDIEVFESGMIHWFYRDRENGDLLGSQDDNPLPNIPDEALKLLNKFR